MKKFYFKYFLGTLLLLCSTVASAHDFEVDGIYYNITDATAKTVEVTYSGSSLSSVANEYTGAVIIPSTVTYNGATYSVTSIRNFAFEDCTGLISVTIPNSVTSIGNRAFRDCPGLTSVTIGNGVTSINAAVFDGCTGLTSVTIGSGVTSIGNYAFRDCTGLTAVHINDLAAWCRIDFSGDSSNPLSYAHNLYLNGEKVTDLVIPDGVTEIKKYAFRNCTGLASVTIGNSVTSIGGSAFYYCTGLTSVTIGNSVTSIGGSAFYYCTGLTSVTIGNSVTSIGDNAFYYCTGLRTVYNHSLLNISKGSTNNGYVANYANKVINAPNGSIEGDFVFGIIDGVNTLCGYIGNGGNITLPENYNGENYVIGSNIFKDNITITGITISDGVTSIGDSAFSGCDDLASVTIGNSVTSIGESAFSGCSGLTSVTIGNGVTSIGDYAFHNCSGLTGVTIGNSVTSIGVHTFSHCTGLTCVTIGNSVTSIGNSAFNACTGLTSVTIGNSVTSIGDNAFQGCNDLTSITIPNSVKSIGNSAFNACTGLTGVTIGNSVTSIGNSAFYGCTNLKTVYNCSALNIVAGSIYNGYVAYYADEVINAPNGSIEGDFAFAIIDGVNTLVEYLGNGGDVTLPENYNGENYVIGSNIFKDNTTITGITISNSVTSIGEWAFRGCTGLTGIVIPNSVTSIGYGAFDGCTGLTSVTVGSGVTSIGGNAFYDCTGLTAVHINDLAAWCRIDFSGDSSNPLYYTDNLYLNGEKVTDLVIPSDITEIKNFAFEDCDCLTSVTIPNSVTGIGNYAFYGCDGLTSVTIPNSVTSIGRSVFEFCDGLTSVIIGNSVTSIGNYAFRNCTGLTGIVIPKSVTSIGNSAFYGCENLKTVTNNSSLKIVKGSTDNGYVACYADKVINAPNGSIEGDFVFGIIDGVNTLVEYIGNGGDVTLPENYNGEHYMIGDYAFYYCDGLTSVTIGNSVTSIGERAFYCCTGLTSITIPNSVISIGDNAFSGCWGLRTVYNCSSLNIVAGSIGNGAVAYYADKVINAPNGSIEGDFAFGIIDGVNTLFEYIGNGGDVTLPENYNGENYVIGNNIFKNNTTITGITISNSVSRIGYRAFYGCTGLTSIEIPNSVTSIGNDAFSGCSGLTSVTIGNGVTSIGDYAFYDCTGLTCVTIGNSVTGIGVHTFSHCSDLTSVTIPNSVTSIGDYAFAGCSGLASVTIGNSVTSIGDNAFQGCNGLASVTIPNSVTSIGDEAFRYCNCLTAVYINDLAAWCRIDFSGYDSTPLYYAHNLYLNGEKVTDLVIPSDITEIKNYAFQGCYGLTSIEIPNSVTSIGISAFSGCSGLTCITIPNSVKSIGYDAFRNCSGLARVIIGNSVTSIGDNAFSGCGGLRTVYNCSSLNIVKGSTDNGYVAYYAYEVINAPNASIEGDFAFAIIDGVNTLVEYIGNGGDVTLPENYNGENYVIGANAFKDNTAITGVTISDGVTNIGDNAFQGCNGLASVTIGNSVTSIGNAVFYDCTSLTGLEIPNSVTSIGYCAFYDCTSLASVTIGNSVTSIGYCAFYDCTSLASVTIGNSVTSIGDYAFDGCSGLTSIEIPNSVTSIGNDAFSGCSGLTSVTIGNGVTSIGIWAFAGCSELTSVTIGNSVTSIGEKAFYGCTGLTAVHINDLAAWCRIDFSGYDSTPLYYAHLYLNGEKVTDLVIPNSVTSIGIWAFAGCSELTSVTIPNSVTSIGSSAFRNCTGLTSVTIGNGVTSIGNYAFSGCCGLASVIIGNSVTSIGDYAFDGCENLKTVTNNSSLNIVAGSTDNGYVAYYADEVINAPSSSIIGDYKFTSANGVNTLVEYLGDGGDVTLPENYNGENYVIGANAFKNNTAITSVTIPDGVTSIGNTAFYYCQNLTSVKLGKNVTTLGDFAFQYCTSLNDITLPNSLQAIGKASLSHCGFTNVVIPNKVKTIGDYAFDYCENLAQVTIGNCVTGIGHYAFYGCENLKTVTNNSSLNIVAGSTDNGYVAYYADEVITPPSISYTSLPAYFNTDNGLPGTIEGNNHIWESETMYFETPKSGICITVFDINEGEYYNNFPIVALGELEFYDADGNKINYTASDVTTNSLESKEGSLAGLCDGDYSTFYHSTWSGNGTTPTDYVYLDVKFSQAVDAVSIKIVGRDNKRLVPTSIGITENGEYCEISAPTNGTCGESTTWSYNDGVLTISGSGAVTDKGWNKYINNIIGVVIEEGITSIMDDAFLRYSNLTSATLPSTLAVLPRGVFSRTGLTGIEIPEGVTTLGMWAFDNCPALATVTLPTTLTSISDYAFENCTALASVTSNAVIAPTLGANVFGGIAEGATLTYPQGSDYSSWSDYFTISLFTPGDINGDSEVNVGDFAALVNIIFNSESIDDATKAVADINADGEVNVGDFAALVNLIFNSGSQVAPKRAAARAATGEATFYIEPFSIAPGEEKVIPVLMENPGEKFSQLQFDITLPEGVEIVFDEDNFCHTIDRGSRLASVYNIDAQDVNGGVKVLALTTNPKAYIKGESGDVLLITVQAADDIADGVYDLSINNVVLSHQDGSTVKATSTTAAITVSSTTGITNVEGAEGSDVYYDLQGHRVTEIVKGRVYIKNGSKFIAQ